MLLTIYWKEWLLPFWSRLLLLAGFSAWVTPSLPPFHPPQITRWLISHIAVHYSQLTSDFFFFNSHGSPSRLSYGEEGVKHNSKGVLLVCFAFVITIIMKKKAFSNLCWFHIYRPVILAVSVPAGTVSSLGDCFPSSSQLPPAQRFSRQVDRVTGAEFECPGYPGQYDHSLSLPPTGEAPLLWWICVHSVSALVKPIHQNDLSK